MTAFTLTVLLAPRQLYIWVGRAVGLIAIDGVSFIKQYRPHNFMNAPFWGKMSREYLKNHPEPPPLTTKDLATFETRLGLKLPKSLIKLLRIKNGGPIQNSDFMFKGREYTVFYIKSVGEEDGYEFIRPYSKVLEGRDANDIRKKLTKKAGDLSKMLYLAESDGHPYAFALNYNHRNKADEPTVYCVWVDCDDADAKCVANSFGEFLAGQYFGDKRSLVDFAESKKFLLVAEGGYEGRYKGKHKKGSLTLSGLPVKVSWKICSHRNRLIIFQKEDWAGQMTLTRAELLKSKLVFDFPSLESYGVDIEPDLAELIRPAIEIEMLSKFEADLIPDCYELTLHVQPGDKSWFTVHSSSAYQGRWKNSKTQCVSSSIKSANKKKLTQTLQAVADCCSS